MSLYAVGSLAPLVSDDPEDGVLQTYADGYGLRLHVNSQGSLVFALVMSEEKLEYFVRLSPEFVKKAHELLGKHIN